jgi:hypothetical protein
MTTENPRASFAAALGELRLICEQLSPGRASPDEVERLTVRAAVAVSTARASLRRAGRALEVLGATAVGPPGGADDNGSDD